ncbi:MAG: dTDP-4-dehydrorhamnose 3,5-epimerase [Clostridia bacterium]|nr:dTDP-4-dehydrorhamnose 3,5-epimerase [Clostridia bacterium]
MGFFRFRALEIPGLFLVEPEVYNDERGFFFEAYNYRDFKAMGLAAPFVQDNHSRSKKGVLRGLHFQVRHPQGKLVRAVAGEIFDVAVDLRAGSPTYKRWYGVVLSSKNKRQLYIPEGCAHGFLVLSGEAEVIYKCTEYYYPEDEEGIIWNDPEIGINWPLPAGEAPVLSKKDKGFKRLCDFRKKHA